MSEEYIQCPYCMEDIKAGAILCKHCKSNLQSDNGESSGKPNSPISIKKWAITILIGAIIIIAFIIYLLPHHKKQDLVWNYKYNCAGLLEGKYSFIVGDWSVEGSPSKLTFSPDGWVVITNGKGEVFTRKFYLKEDADEKVSLYQVDKEYYFSNREERTKLYKKDSAVTTSLSIVNTDYKSYIQLESDTVWDEYEINMRLIR